MEHYEYYIDLLKDVEKLLSTPEPSRNIFEVKRIVTQYLDRHCFDRRPVNRPAAIEWVNDNYPDHSYLSDDDKVNMYRDIYDGREEKWIS